MLKCSARARTLATALVFVIAAGHPQSAFAAEASLYRIFLRDGAALVSYGEYARVSDRVIFTMPIGEGDANLQLVSIADDTVDWDRTEQYTHAVRAKHYAETQGPNDFARLANRVTEALNDIRLTRDPARQIAMAEEARTNLARWPFDNYGYGADEIGPLVGMLDDVLAEMRAAAGQPIELSLAATTMPTPPVPLLPPPDLRGNIEQAFSAATHAPEPQERLSLLEAIAAALKEPVARREGWAATLNRRVASELESELRTERAYADLTGRTLAGASARADRADVTGIERLTRTVLAADDRLGRKRPKQMASLLASLDLWLERARELRLARDAWTLRREIFASYRRAIAPAVDQLRKSRTWLDQIRRQAGPSPTTLAPHAQRVVMARHAFEAVTPPPELAPAHGLYTSAFHLARRAAATRRNAVSSNDMSLSRDASSAAAGALMLLERADEELNRLAALPVR
jgi:hypothetical protein